MDQQTVTYLLIAALLATALLIALAVVVPRMPRRGGGSMTPATAGAGGPMLLDSAMATSRAAMSLGSPASGNPGRVNGSNGAADDADGPSSDALTGLLSPSRWGRVVADEDARVRRYRRPATIVMIELDGLDRLTARLGDAAGDRLVPAVADTIRRLAREADFVARVGDGRFAVLLPETDEIQAINYVERVRRTCDLWLESGAVALKLAMGWASASGDDSLLDAGRIATERMYAEIHRNARRSSDLVPDEAAEAEEHERRGVARGLVLPQADPSSRRRAGVRATVHDERAVDDHGLDPGRVAARLVVGRVRSDRRRVEDHDVGERAVAERPALAQAEPRGRRRGHLAHRLLEAQQRLVADELPEDARERAVRARARLRADERGVRADHADRVRHERPKGLASTDRS